MGFLDKAFDIAKNVATIVSAEIEKSANEVREIKQKYERLNDEDLLRIVNDDRFFGKTQKEKGIAFSILKKRGFDPEEINSLKT